MTTSQKNEIVDLIELTRQSLGSQSHVANRADVSEATISQMRNRNWGRIKDAMWRKVGYALGWETSGWQTVNTENTRILFDTYSDAKQHKMWLAVAARAGSGKTESAKAYFVANRRNACFYLQAREWRKRAFLRELGNSLGLPYTTKHHAEEMIVKITAFFQDRVMDNPVLIIDEADKLHPDAMRAFIPLYNVLKDTIGVVIQGVPNLRRQFVNGQKYDKKGYDELVSRFGGEFITLPGFSQRDVYAVCEANGVTDKAAKLEVWKKLPKAMESFGGLRSPRAASGRRLERLIKNQRQLLTLKSDPQ